MSTHTLTRKYFCLETLLVVICSLELLIRSASASAEPSTGTASAPAAGAPVAASNSGGETASPAHPEAVLPSGEGMPTEPTSAAPATDEADDAAIETELEGMEKVRTTYEHARKLMGGEHVLLTAAGYFSRTCNDSEKSIGTCNDKSNSAGVAGLVSIPLFGIGGGHGLDWLPVLHTEEEAQSFEAFKARAQEYYTLVDNLDGVKSKDLARRAARELVAIVDGLTQRADQDDASYYETARTLKHCIDSVFGGATLKLKAASAILATVDSELVKTCTDVLAGLAAGDHKARIKAAVTAIKKYFAVLGADESLTRHNFLIGPALGFPITKEVTKTFLWGALAEFGFRKGLRFAASGGFVGSYQKPLAPIQGLYVGLGLSGEFGDDLVHFISKAATPQ